MVNPRRIKAFRDAEGLIAKTDKLDASLIARFAHVMADELRPLRDAGQAGLKALSTRRRQLTESIAIEKTRLKQAFDPLILDSCREMIALLEDRRRAIEAELDRRIEAEDRMARRRAILSSMPGIAARISTLVVIEMPELGEIGRKEAASLAGLAPHPSQSGLSLGRNAISGGRPCLRAAFYMAALVAVRSHPRFKQIYLDLRAAGKPQRSPSSPSPAEWSASQTPSFATTSLSIKQASLDPRNTVASVRSASCWTPACAGMAPGRRGHAHRVLANDGERHASLIVEFSQALTVRIKVCIHLIWIPEKSTSPRPGNACAPPLAGGAGS